MRTTCWNLQWQMLSLQALVLGAGAVPCSRQSGLLVGDINVDKVLAPSSDSKHGSSLTFHHKLKQHGSMLYASYQTLNFFMPVTLLIRILEIFMKNVRGQFNKTGLL